MSSSSSPAAVGSSFAAWTAQRIEAYVVLADPGGGIATVPAAGRAQARVPGAVLAHGETPRAAAGRALAEAVPWLTGGAAAVTPGSPSAAGPAGEGSGRPVLRLRQVLSDVLPLPAGRGLHVLRLVFDADSGLSLPIDAALLRDPIAAPAARRLPGAPPLVQRPAAYALVIRDEQVLLSRVTGLGVWTLPGGGIDHGEHPDDAVRRETFEETGLRLSGARLADVDSRHFTGESPDRVTENFHGVRILYRGAVTDRARPQVQEVDGSTEAAAWVPLAGLDRLRLADVVRSALARLR